MDLSARGNHWSFLNPEIDENLKKELDLNYYKAFSSRFFICSSWTELIKSQKQDYDLFIAAYHDQALPVIKAVAGFNAVNLTAGLTICQSKCGSWNCFLI